MTTIAAPPVVQVLLVEDDDGDALLVEELLLDSGERFDVVRATSVAHATDLLRGPERERPGCVLVDLGLPDAVGLDAITRIRDAAPELAVVVLTGLADRARGVEAVAAGAQDYLVKGQTDGDALARVLRYAVERRRTELELRRLALAERRDEENALLARGLLPQLHVDGPRFGSATRYRPGGAGALLGGDFFDAVLCEDGTVVRAVIGDVCGHGPAEAAVGVALRIAWRTMVLAGAAPEDVLASVDAVLRRERDLSGAFATACDLTIDLDTDEVTVRRHGHPPPLLLGPEVRWMEEAPPSPPLGCLDHLAATPATVALHGRWALLLLTDGIYEGRAGDDRLGMDAFGRLVAELGEGPGGLGPDGLLEGLLERTRALHGGELDDDVALLWLGRP